MGHPAVFQGNFTRLLSASGILLRDGSLLTSNGAPNFINNGQFERECTEWVQYDDAASAPIDAVGGTGYVTISRVDSSLLSAYGHGLITKDAVNRQGNGVSIPVTIDGSHKSRLMRIDFSYTTSTNYASSDMYVYLYDITNATLISLSVNAITASTSVRRFTALCTVSSSTNYRLIFHTVSTNALAYTISLDDLKFSPVEYLMGTGSGGSLGLTPTTIPYTDSFGQLASDTLMNWDSTNHRLVVGATTSSTNYFPTVKARLEFKDINSIAVLNSELISNTADRDFSSDTGHWTGTNWAVGGSALTHTTGSTASAVYTLATPTTVGQNYIVTITVTTVATSSSNGIRVVIGGVNTNHFATEVGTLTAYQVVIPTNSVGTTLAISPQTNWNGYITSISLKTITPSDMALWLTGSDFSGGQSSASMEFRVGASTSAARNQFIGTRAGCLVINSTGMSAFGYQSMARMTTGSNCAAFGGSAMSSAVNPVQSTAIGQYSMSSAFAPLRNTAVGYFTSYYNTVGSDNTAIGASSLTNNSSGVGNTAVGSLTGTYLLSGRYHTYIGYGVGPNSGYGSTAYGQTAIGVDSTGAPATPSNDVSDDFVLGTALSKVRTPGTMTVAKQLIGGGTTTNDSAATGVIGEYIEANSAGVSPTASDQTLNVTSISLTAGDWDVEGTLALDTSSVNSTDLHFGVSLSTGAFDVLNKGGIFGGDIVDHTDILYHATGARRISIATTTTVYLVAKLSYTAAGTATYTTSSILRARRVR